MEVRAVAAPIPQVQLAHGAGYEAERIRYPVGAPFIPRHRHGRYQVSSCRGGVGDYRYRGAVFHAPAGSLQVFHPDEAHAYEPLGCDPAGGDYRVLFLDPERFGAVAREELGWPEGRLPGFAAPILTRRALTAAFRQTHAALLDPARPELERDTRLLLLLVDLLRVDAGTPRRPGVNEPAAPGERAAVRRARDFLAAHAGEKVPLASLARAAGLGAFRLHRLFTARWGLPPHAYQLQLRVERARSALGRGEPLAMVAADAGFVDQAHLHRVFKRLVGVTPGQYARGRQERPRRVRLP